jgi:hypothetical protein
MKNILIFTTFMDVVMVMHEQQLRNINGGFPYTEYHIGEFSAMCTGTLEKVVNSPS